MSAPYPTYEDEEDAMYRQSPEYREEPVDVFCRRCEDPVDEDDTVEGLCPDCMKNAGLVRCDYCGRAFAKEIAKVEQPEGFKPFYYCPFCVKDMERGAK